MSEKLRVLHIITRLDPGGSSINTIETVSRLNPDFYDCTLISGRTIDPELKNLLVRRNVHCIFVDELRRNIHPWHDGAAFFKLLTLIRRGRYDIVHTHTSKAGILGRWAARLAGVSGIIHTPHGHVFYGYFNRFVSYVFLVIERLTARITDRIITLTERGRQEHIDLKVAAPRRFAVIPSGIDLEQFTHIHDSPIVTRASLGLSDGQFMFGCVARLEPVKGHRHLIEAMAKIVEEFPQAALLLVGDGSQRRELEALCRHLHVEQNVCFVGFQNNVIPYVRLMDCFVLASLNEGMGRSLLEAMALAKPVIATRTGGIPELIEHGHTGWLINPRDGAGLRQAMRMTIQNPAQAAQCGQAAQRFVTDRYNIATMVQSIDRLYREVRREKKL